MDIKALDQTYVANTYARFPLLLTEGKGSLVWDEQGKEYILLTAWNEWGEGATLEPSKAYGYPPGNPGNLTPLYRNATGVRIVLCPAIMLPSL